MQANDDRRLTVTAPEVVGYDAALDLQRELVERVLASGGRENFLLPVEHPAVITVGRSGSEGDVLAGAPMLRRRGVRVVETNRGGKVTLHMPGQLVAYPIIDLTPRGRDLHRYLRDLETWLIALLGEFGIEAGVNPPHTGVWVGEAKVASIGIACRRWVSYHGVALNVAPDMSLFDLVVPCGLNGVRMADMRSLGCRAGVGQVAARGAEIFAERFGFTLVNRSTLADLRANIAGVGRSAP